MTKKRIILTSLVGAVAIATITTTLTVAWYGASSNLRVNYFDVTITGDNDLKVSTSDDLDSFTSILSSEKLKEDLSKDFFFEPVSSMCRNNWMNENKDKPVFYDCSNYYPSKIENGLASPEEASYTGYYSKKIYLLTNAQGFFATLDIDSEKDGKEKYLFENDEDSNFIRAQALYAQYEKMPKEENPYYGLTVNDIKDGLDNLAKCLRVSILVNLENHYDYYVIDPYKDANNSTEFGGLLNNDGDEYFDTYVSEGKEKEIVFGEVNDSSFITYDAPHDFGEQEEPQLGNSFTGKRKDTAYTFNYEESYNQGLRFAKEDSISLDEIDSKVKIPLTKDVPTAIVVSFYLEGWDRECINATMGASFDALLSFKLLGGNI